MDSRVVLVRLPSSIKNPAPQKTKIVKKLLQVVTRVSKRDLQHSPNLTQDLCSQKNCGPLPRTSAAFSSSRPFITSPYNPLRTNSHGQQPRIRRALSTPDGHPHHEHPPVHRLVHEGQADSITQKPDWQEAGLPGSSSHHVSMHSCTQRCDGSQHEKTQPIRNRQPLRPVAEQFGRLGMPGNKIRMPDWDYWAEQARQSKQLPSTQSNTDKAMAEAHAGHCRLSGQITIRRVKAKVSHTHTRLENYTLRFPRPQNKPPSNNSPPQSCRHRGL